MYISIFNDDLLESTEYFSVTITLIPEESDNVTVSNGQAEIYIIDDELRELNSYCTAQLL